MVIIQRPNKLVVIAVILSLLAMVAPVDNIFHALAVTAWIIWAYEELAHGVNWFRRVLGAIVMVVMVMDIVRIK